MKPSSRAPLPFWFLLVFLFGVSGTSIRAQEKHDDKRGSPRATVRTLLTAVTAARGKPRLIQEAVACLDLSGLPAQDQNAPLLATQLEAILRARDVDTELIPEHLEEAVYVFPDGPGQHLGLQRMPDGRWLFDRETVAEIPKLHAEAVKRLQEKNREAASLNLPAEYASARATFRSLLAGYRRQDFDRIVGCLDLNDVPAVARREVGEQLANKLRQIILRHRVLVVQELPDSNFSDPYVWLSEPEGGIELVRLHSAPHQGSWAFSRFTVRSIEPLFVSFEDRPYLDEILNLGATGHLPNPWSEPELWLRRQLPGPLRASVLTTQYFRLDVYQLLGFVLVPVLAFGVAWLTTWLLVVAVQGFLHWRGWIMTADVIRKGLRPTGRFAGLLFLRWGLLVLGPNQTLLVPLLAVLNPLVWLLGMWAVFRLIDLIGGAIEARLIAAKRRGEITQMLWPVASLAFKIIVCVVTTFHMMTLLSWDVTAVLTGLGIGGLAFALGAQDSLKNLFGSFTLIADRPFVVGEVVKIGDHELGVIEVVGLRSTRIRTTDDTLLIVPNSNLTTMNITNFGRRRYRRYVTNIGVAYSTPLERLIAFRDRIQEVIRRQERTRKDHFEVAINDLRASSIEILVNVYFEVTDRHQELVARDALILDILRQAEELHIALAFPTQTIHLVPPANGAVEPRLLHPELEGPGANSA